MIEVRDLTFTYAGSHRPALQGLDLTIPEGEVMAVVGPNGAGKSTLCYALSGFIPHFFNGDLLGSIHVDGNSVTAATLGELAGVVGLVFQNPFSQISGARFSVREEIAFGLENLGVPREEMEPRIEAAMALTGLVGLADRSPYALSGGQQQRLAIASMIVMRPQVLVLDEPTSQLDPAGTQEVLAALRDLAAERRMTVVVVEHKLEWLATFADRVLLLSGGEAVALGAPADVLASPLLEAHGVDPNRYARAARLAQQRDLARPGAPVPVTLEQATEFFS